MKIEFVSRFITIFRVISIPEEDRLIKDIVFVRIQYMSGLETSPPVSESNALTTEQP